MCSRLHERREGTAVARGGFASDVSSRSDGRGVGMWRLVNKSIVYVKQGKECETGKSKTESTAAYEAAKHKSVVVDRPQQRRSVLREDRGGDE